MISLFDLKPRPTGGGGSSGATGPTGATGLTGLRAFAFSTSRVFENQYKIGEIVFYAGSHWICIADNDALIPSTSPLYWSPYSFVGSPGATGPVGATGADAEAVNAFYNGTDINASATTDFYLAEYSLFNYSNANSTDNFNFNFKASSSQSLNDYLNVGEYISCEVLVKNGATAYKLIQVTVDALPPTDILAEQVGAVFPEGTVNAIDTYRFKIFKLSNNSFNVAVSVQPFYIAAYKLWSCLDSENAPLSIYTTKEASQLSGSLVYSDASLSTPIPDSSGTVSFTFNGQGYYVYSGSAISSADVKIFSVNVDAGTPTTIYINGANESLANGIIVYSDITLQTPVAAGTTINYNDTWYQVLENGALQDYIAWNITYGKDGVTTLYSAPTYPLNELANEVFGKGVYTDIELTTPYLYDFFVYDTQLYLTFEEGATVIDQYNSGYIYLDKVELPGEQYRVMYDTASGDVTTSNIVLYFNNMYATGNEAFASNIYYTYNGNYYKTTEIGQVRKYDTYEVVNTLLGNYNANVIYVPITDSGDIVGKVAYSDTDLTTPISNEWLTVFYQGLNKTVYCADTTGVISVYEQTFRPWRDFSTATTHYYTSFEATSLDEPNTQIYSDSTLTTPLSQEVIYAIYDETLSVVNYYQILDNNGQYILGQPDVWQVSITDGFFGMMEDEFNNNDNSVKYNINSTTIPSFNDSGWYVDSGSIYGFFNYNDSPYLLANNTITSGSYKMFQVNDITIDENNTAITYVFVNSSSEDIIANYVYTRPNLTYSWSNKIFKKVGSNVIYVTTLEGIAEYAGISHMVVNDVGDGVNLYTRYSDGPTLAIGLNVYTDIIVSTPYTGTYFSVGDLFYATEMGGGNINQISKKFEIIKQNESTVTNVYTVDTATSIEGQEIYNTPSRTDILLSGFKFYSNGYYYEIIGNVVTKINYYAFTSVDALTTYYSSSATLDIGSTLYLEAYLDNVVQVSTFDTSNITYNISNGVIVSPIAYRYTADDSSTFYSDSSSISVGVTVYQDSLLSSLLSEGVLSYSSTDYIINASGILEEVNHPYMIMEGYWADVPIQELIFGSRVYDGQYSMNPATTLATTIPVDIDGDGCIDELVVTAGEVEMLTVTTPPYPYNPISSRQDLYSDSETLADGIRLFDGRCPAASPAPVNLTITGEDGCESVVSAGPDGYVSYVVITRTRPYNPVPNNPDIYSDSETLADGITLYVGPCSNSLVKDQLRIFGIPIEGSSDVYLVETSVYGVVTLTTYTPITLNGETKYYTGTLTNNYTTYILNPDGETASGTGLADLDNDNILDQWTIEGGKINWDSANEILIGGTTYIYFGGIITTSTVFYTPEGVASGLIAKALNTSEAYYYFDAAVSSGNTVIYISNGTTASGEGIDDINGDNIPEQWIIDETGTISWVSANPIVLGETTYYRFDTPLVSGTTIIYNADGTLASAASGVNDVNGDGNLDDWSIAAGTGVITFATSVQTIYWYSDNAEFVDWYDTSKWYSNSSHTTATGRLPLPTETVIVSGSYSPYVNLDDSRWVQPLVINSGSTGITFYSELGTAVSAQIIGTASFTGNSSYTYNP